MKDARAPSTRDDATSTPMTISGGFDPAEDRGDDDLIIEDVLVEDVSIDGMCGVY